MCFRYRVGLKILDFPDMTQKSVHPVGLHVMAHRHLEKEGYTVVEVREEGGVLFNGALGTFYFYGYMASDIW